VEEFGISLGRASLEEGSFGGLVAVRRDKSPRLLSPAFFACERPAAVWKCHFPFLRIRNVLGSRILHHHLLHVVQLSLPSSLSGTPKLSYQHLEDYLQ
jgi:hypothetical protein